MITPASHPHQPLTPPPGSAFVARLADTTLWMKNGGQVVAIADMEDGHLWSVLGYIRWFARELAELDPKAKGLDLDTYITTRPVWGALSAELVRRGLLATPDGALTVLRRDGLASWEVDG